MKRNNLAILSIVFLSAILLGNLLYFAAPINAQAPSRTKLAPRTATLQEYTEYNGARTLVAMYSHAIRADGSEVFIERKVDPTTNESTEAFRKLAFADGNMVFFNPANSIKSTFALGHLANIYMPKRDPGSKCRAGHNGELIDATPPTFSEEEILGMPTIKAVSQHGELKLTQWFSLRHGCELVKQTTEFGKNGGVSQQEVLSISLGEPDPSLFELPSGAMEAKPSILLSGRMVNSDRNEKQASSEKAAVPDPGLEKLYAVKGVNR